MSVLKIDTFAQIFWNFFLHINHQFILVTLLPPAILKKKCLGQRQLAKWQVFQKELHTLFLNESCMYCKSHVIKNTSLQRDSYSKQRNQNSDIYITQYILQNHYNAQL